MKQSSRTVSRNSANHLVQLKRGSLVTSPKIIDEIQFEDIGRHPDCPLPGIMMMMPLLFTILVEPIWETRPFTFKSSFLTSWGNQTPLFVDESLRGQSKRLLLAVASLMRQAERAGATISLLPEEWYEYTVLLGVNGRPVNELDRGHIIARSDYMTASLMAHLDAGWGDTIWQAVESVIKKFHRTVYDDENSFPVYLENEIAKASAPYDKYAQILFHTHKAPYYRRFLDDSWLR